MALSEKDFLHCEGRNIVNKDGEKVLLRGTNLGGWLLTEAWMSPIRGFSAQWDIDTTLENRFGKKEAERLLNLYQDNFITESDLDFLKNMGFNCLRVPFWYRNLQTDDNGTFKRNPDGSVNFGKLDWVVEECSKRNMYVILDMHGVPGFQSIAHHSCRENHCELYGKTESGERFRKLAAQLWSAIAEHFKNNPAVAGYDLMNEPMCDWKGRQKKNGEYHAVYDILYSAVRKADSRHIVFLEGIWTPFDMPRPGKRWKNCVYEYHLYLPSDLTFALFPYAEKLRGFNNPVYIGEFSPCRGTASWEKVLGVFKKHSYNYTTWTYKGHSDGDKSDWFIFASSGHGFDLDINNASAEEIEKRWGEELRTGNSFALQNTGEQLKHGCEPDI